MLQQTPATVPWQKPAPGSIILDRLAGAVVEVKDLEATRAFYETIFQTAGGEWQVEAKRMLFHCGSQQIEFVRRPKPRTLAVAGQHHGYRVPRSDLQRMVDSLTREGSTVNWWREDHPDEREVSPYINDPSGNIVQLVASDGDGLLLNHAVVIVRDLEEGEVIFLNALDGELEHYHGWRTEDGVDAREVWYEGDDPCAPWTRRAIVSFRSHKPEPNSIPQLFMRYGESMVAVILTGKRLFEPLEEILRGTPRLVFHSPQSANDVARYLSGVRVSSVALVYDGGKIPFELDGKDIYFRDRSGNFLQITCDR
ncbi:MAG: VOC family protein [Gemmatimonadetes bacterium]|nr:VOC family protein [Gemmatimonadota bacterium]